MTVHVGYASLVHVELLYVTLITSRCFRNHSFTVKKPHPTAGRNWSCFPDAPGSPLSPTTIPTRPPNILACTKNQRVSKWRCGNIQEAWSRCLPKLQGPRRMRGGCPRYLQNGTVHRQGPEPGWVSTIRPAHYIQQSPLLPDPL
jgi:hypothetical protein